jgi:hypothetical protein
MDRDRVVAQTLREAQQEGPFEYANQICAMTLRVVGTSPAGLIVQVTSAKCEPAHGLRCSSACSMQGESVFVLPDGMSTVGSGR